MNLRDPFLRARFWASSIVGLASVLAFLYGWYNGLRGGGCSRPLHYAISLSPRWTLMPREGAIIFRDIVGKLDVLTVECGRCAGPGR